MVLDARDMRLEVIQARFGAVPDDIAGMMSRISDRETLRSMLRQAIVCGDIQSLRETISTIINPC